MHRKYYQPSTGLVEYLRKELLALQPKPQIKDAGAGGKISFIRSKDKRGSIAKNKTDFMERIFQSLADIIYFLEFIEDHSELHGIYEKVLKDLFGINNDPETRQSHKQNRGGAFERLIRASLLIDATSSKELDFRVHLIKTLIVSSIAAMRSRISDINEINIMEPSLVGIWSWGNLLSSRSQTEIVPAGRMLGFYPFKYDPTHNEICPEGHLLPQTRVNDKGQTVKKCSKCDSWIPVMTKDKSQIMGD